MRISPPPGGKHLVTLGDNRAELSLCEVHGECLAYGLVGDRAEPFEVVKLVKKAERVARERGYTRLLLDTSNDRIVTTANRTGWKILSVIMAKDIYPPTNNMCTTFEPN